MQLQILKPDANGNHYPDYDVMIKNSRDPEERKYLISVKESKAKWAAKGYPDEGFAYGIIYTAKMSCGHYELFQHPIYRAYGKDPDEDDIMESVEDTINTVRLLKAERRKCTRCICGW